MPSIDIASDIVVVYGGTSAEREISVRSGLAVEAALKERGYQVRYLDPAFDNVEDFDWRPNSIAVMMLHGTYGEDGQIQAALDSLNVRYTGSNAAASRLAFNKHLAKQRFQECHLRTPDWQIVSRDANEEVLFDAVRKVGLPLFVKPVSQGSSIGVSYCSERGEVQAAFEQAAEYDGEILLEAAIIGEEWTVPVLDNEPLPSIRVSSQHRFFDYSAKYVDGDTRYEVFNLDRGNTKQSNLIQQSVCELAANACQALGTTGICRVDLMVDHLGQAWLLEVNTIPGMTRTSLVPKSAAVLGWSMGELCERILFSAFANSCD